MKGQPIDPWLDSYAARNPRTACLGDAVLFAVASRPGSSPGRRNAQPQDLPLERLAEGHCTDDRSGTAAGRCTIVQNRRGLPRLRADHRVMAPGGQGRSGTSSPTGSQQAVDIITRALRRPRRLVLTFRRPPTSAHCAIFATYQAVCSRYPLMPGASTRSSGGGSSANAKDAVSGLLLLPPQLHLTAG